MLTDRKFYPADLKNNKWLNYYSKEFNTVEVNSSFYHLPKLKTFVNWGENTSGDFCYIRMHGPKGLYCSSYSENELKKIAVLIKKNLKINIENYVYFNNDAEGYAVENAKTLMNMVL